MNFLYYLFLYCLYRHRFSFFYFAACRDHQPNASTTTGNFDTFKVKEPITDSAKSDSTKELVNEPQLMPGKSAIEIISYKVIYNDDFEPTFQLKLKNNLPKSIIAFEFGIFPKSPCQIKAIHYKNAFPPGQTITLNQKLSSMKECAIESAQIFIGNYVLSDGSKGGDPGIHYLINKGT